jgi:hypothetical protein
MTVDFAFKRAPRYRVATMTWKGPWSDAKIHRHFLQIASWAKTNHLRTGKWIFLEPGDRKWEVGIEVRGPARPGDGIRMRTFPAARVASVTYDPDVVSPEVIWHGVTDWLRWRKKEKKIRSVGGYREIYDGDPWRDKKVYAHTTVQVVVRP